MRLFKGLFTILLLGIIVMAATAQEEQPMSAEEYFAPRGVLLVIAHQGGEHERPSNTMVAFDHAVELGVDVLEMDIHSTSDGVLVTIHDDTVDRTTDGTGRVQDFAFEELQALDAGDYWHPEENEAEHPYRDQGITIPALEEIFQTFPDMPMIIEIKQEEPSIAEPFCALLREYEMTDQVIVASFRETAMDEFRAECPEVLTAAVESEVRVFYMFNKLDRTADYEREADAFHVPEYAGDEHVVTESFVTNAQAMGIAVHVWTVNEEEQMQRMIDLGVDGIMTDNPTRLLELLGREIP